VKKFNTKLFLQILLLSIGTLLPFIVLGVLGSLKTAYGLIIFLVSLAIIPALFIIPTAIRKPKLLLIAGSVAAVFVLFNITTLFFGAPILELFFALSIIGIAGLGVLAGFLFRLAGKKSDATTSKRVIGIFTGIISTITSLFLVFCMLWVFIFVNPVSTFFAYFQIQSFVAETFYEFDLDVGYPYHDWKGGGFRSNVVLSDSEDFDFWVTYRSGRFSTHYIQNHSWRHPSPEQIIEDLRLRLTVPTNIPIQ